jgi:transposase
MRQRDMLVRYAAPHMQHMPKARTEMHVQVPHVVDARLRVTGTRILPAILAGARAPATVAPCREARCQQDEAPIARAFQGKWRAEHLCAWQQADDLYQCSHGQVAQVAAHVETLLRTCAETSDGPPRPKNPRARQRPPQRNAPPFAVSALLYRR